MLALWLNGPGVFRMLSRESQPPVPPGSRAVPSDDTVGYIKGPEAAAQGSAFIVAGDIESCKAPRVAVAESGRYVITWWNSSGETFAGLYDRTNTLMRPPIQLTQALQTAQSWSSVAMAEDGGFVVAWAGQSEVAGTRRDGVFLRRFTAEGEPLGEAICAYHGERAGEPAVALAPHGSAVVVYTHNDADEAGIYGTLVDPSGVVHEEIVVNQLQGKRQRHPCVAVAPSGEFVVAWDTAHKRPGLGRSCKHFLCRWNPKEERIPRHERRPGRTATAVGRGGPERQLPRGLVCRGKRRSLCALSRI